MRNGLSNDALESLSGLVSERIGLHFPPERWRDMERAFGSAARELGFDDEEACRLWLLQSPLSKSRIEVLASHLVIGETSFFRESCSFDALEERVLPGILEARRKENDRRIRIWSAGCATGEEPCSVAILLDRMLPDRREWDITILATDINPRFLRKAAEGVYGEWSLRGTPAWVREGYFTRKKGGLHELRGDIRKMITFSYLNLVEDVYPSLASGTNGMDVILCRNLLMYFSPERAAAVVRGLRRCLVEGGWLIVAACETSQTLLREFAAVNFTGAVFYRKEDAKPPPVEDHAPADSGYIPAFLLTEAPATPIPLHATDALPVPEPGPGPRENAFALYEAGRYAEAAEALLAALALDRSDAAGMALLARAFANEGRLSEALGWCEKAVAADRLDPGRHYLLATILQELGRVDEAASSLRRAIYLDQDFVLAHFALGNLSRRRGRLEESAGHFGHALSLARSRPPDEVLPESEGLTAGRLVEIIRSITCEEKEP
jgi:chemotaxis protein methyltransferase CheR